MVKMFEGKKFLLQKIFAAAFLNHMLHCNYLNCFTLSEPIIFSVFYFLLFQIIFQLPRAILPILHATLLLAIFLQRKKYCLFLALVERRELRQLETSSFLFRYCTLFVGSCKGILAGKCALVVCF